MKTEISKDILRRIQMNWPSFSLLLIFWITCSVFLFNIEQGSAIYYFVDYRTPLLDSIIYFITTLGEEHVFFIAIAIFLFFDLNKSIWTAVLGISLLMLTYLLKTYFGHPRPSEFFSGFNVEEFLATGWHVVSGNNSFPSGHTSAAFAFYTFLIMIIRTKWVSVLFMVIAISVGISRIYLVQHFLKDILAGSVYGVTLGLLIYFFYRLYYNTSLRISISQLYKRNREGIK